MAIENHIIKAIPKPQIKKPAVKADSATFHKLMNLEYWPYVVGGLVVIGLVVLLVVLIKRRRSKKAFKVSPETEDKKLSGSDLVNVWKKFLLEVPGEFRRSIMLYKPFIVIGESGTGKSLLIDNCTDWKGQADQFYPSHTLDPLLQIYLGSKAVVQEISSALLNDTSKQARRALKKFWKLLFKKKEPVVVVVLNGETLRTDPPESLKKQAQVIRGKINILSRIRKQPVNVSIALTHMDQAEGFFEFSNFLHQNHIPLKLDFTTKTELQDLRTCLEPYEIHLSRALTTLPAKDYLKLVTFMKTAPESFSALSAFIKTLQRPDPLSFTPDVTSLSLASHGGGETPISNPFAAALRDMEIRTFRPLLKHQLAAAALAIFGIGYLLFGYQYERNLLAELNEAMDSFDKNPPRQYEVVVPHLITEVSSKLKYGQSLKYFPDFFPDIGQEVQQRLVSNIRKFYLLPRLKKMAGGDNSEEKTLYLLAIIFATKDNDLGRLASSYKTQWTEKLKLSPVLVEDYVKYNPTSKNITVPWNKMTPITGGTSIYAPQQWSVFFHKISSAVQKPYIRERYFHKLMLKAESFLNIIQKSKQEDLRINIFRLLKQETPLIPFMSLQRKEDESQLRQEPLLETLLYLRQISFIPADAEHLSLDDFIEDARVLMNPPDRTDKQIKFRIGSEEFVFKTRPWDELINRSKLMLFMRDFLVRNKWHDGLSFFQDEDEFDDIVMNANNDGNIFFTGKGRVDGRFTRDAFERVVKPTIAKVPDFLNNLPVDKKEKRVFKAFLTREVEAYSTRYLSEYKDYYHQFGIKASTMKELFYVLNQIQLPFSQFQDFIITVKDNTALDFGDSAYLRPLALKLEIFDFLKRLTQERKGALPELDKFKSILLQMQKELQENKPFVPDNTPKGPGPSQLNARLSATGRIALSIFRQENESYLNLCTAWINSVGIPSGWEDLFLAPIRRTYLLGLQEVESAVAKVWQDLQGMQIHALKNKFPFNRDGMSDVTPDEMKAVFHPQGEFWTTFNTFLAPVCRKMGSTWHERTPPFTRLKLPGQMLASVSRIKSVSRMLWDDKGNPKPLQFLVKPLPMPHMVKGKPVVALFYLKSGKSSVFGFNQLPDWEPFTIEWWENQTATVGIEFNTSLDSSKSYQVIAGPASAWSFYHLLRDAKIEAENVLMWQFESPESKSDVFLVQFEIKPEPWAFFKSSPNPVSSNAQDGKLAGDLNGPIF